ncbi:MAG: hypothetical protein WCC60_00055 [Ilumatobacteraceae bacterium]
MDPQPIPGLTPAAPPPTPPSIARGAALTSAGSRLADDLAFAAELGLQEVRLDVPWALAQPKAGTVDGDVFEQVHAAALTARSLGLQPWFRLLQPAIPKWFDNDGGFTDDRTAGHWWPRWVELVAEQLGEVAAGWVPFEAPYAMAQRLVPDDPRRHGELMRTLVVAWRDAWRVLRVGPPVATSLDVTIERPADGSEAAAQEARRRDQLRWGVWLGGLRDGVVRIPGRADQQLADLDGACSVVGLAIRSDVEAGLQRAGEQGPERPLAVTFRPLGDTDGQRAQSVTAMWRDVRRTAGELEIRSVTITPFTDSPDDPDRPGIATERRELKDSGDAFLHG